MNPITTPQKTPKISYLFVFDIKNAVFGFFCRQSSPKRRQTAPKQRHFCPPITLIFTDFLTRETLKMLKTQALKLGLFCIMKEVRFQKSERFGYIAGMVSVSLRHPSFFFSALYQKGVFT
ncbi:MAG: hypothetical protein J7K65_09670 [Planctomycetes bacterium]|nr:hypothetical protein [Planctomycetota bacterium]